jgi:hypothetical protein
VSLWKCLADLGNQYGGRILEWQTLALKNILKSFCQANKQIFGGRKPLENAAGEFENFRFRGIRLVLEEKQQSLEELDRPRCLDEKQHQIRNQDPNRAARVTQRRQNHRNELLQTVESNSADLRKYALEDLAEAVDHSQVVLEEKRLAENDKRCKVDRLNRNSLHKRQQALSTLAVARWVG